MRTEAMSKTYRAILIDPEARSITEPQTDASLASIHQLIGADTLDQARMVTYNDGVSTTAGSLMTA
jgi:hypothetical protein